MKIEEGKSYTTRRGERVGPMTYYMGDLYPFRSPDGRAWIWNGDFYRSGRYSEHDIVDEWVDEPVAPKAEPVDAPVAPKVEPLTKQALLEKAIAAVADRGLNYGKPEDNFQRIANLWNAHLENRGLRADWALTPVDVALMMDLMKTARLEHQPNHLDSWIDKAGYSACGAEIACRE